MTKQRKPCPFCGGDSHEWFHNKGGVFWYGIQCDRCETSTAGYTSKEEAYNIWNSTDYKDYNWTHCDEQLPEKEGVYLTAYWCFGRATYKVCKFSLDLYATSTTDFDKYDDYKHAGFYVYSESADRFIEVAPHAWMEIKSYQPEEIYEF